MASNPCVIFSRIRGRAYLQPVAEKIELSISAGCYLAIEQFRGRWSAQRLF